MKTVTFLLISFLLLTSVRAVSAADSPKKARAVTLTADQVSGADDIEAAIHQATSNGTRPGTVVLDGRNGPFVLTNADRSLNIFYSNLTLRGVNQAVIQGCDDGLFFDFVTADHILVEDLTFLCSGDGVESGSPHHDVTLRNNIFLAGQTGIGVGPGSRNWTISGNTIQAQGDAIHIPQAEGVVVKNNHLAGFIAVALLGSGNNQVRQNALHASYQGILIGQESWQNKVEGNSILGVSAAGIALEPDVVNNQVRGNRVLCGLGADCQTVDVWPEVAELNDIRDNRP